MTLLIPDVSEYQGDVRWDLVAASGHPAGIARVCYGASHVDDQWRKNFPAMRQYLAWRGFYAYVVAGIDIVAQARFFASLVGKLQPGEVAFADIEEGAGDLTEVGQTWLREVHSAIGGTEGEYSGESFAVAHLSGFRGVRLAWGASYGQPLHIPAQLHQFTDSAAVPGIRTRCDASTFEGSVDDLLNLTNGAVLGATTPEAAMARMGITAVSFVPEALANLADADHDGRLPFYGVKPDGSVFAANGATPIPGLNARNIARDDVVGIAALPGGGVVLACDDFEPDAADSDGWGAPTYVLH